MDKSIGVLDFLVYSRMKMDWYLTRPGLIFVYFVWS